MAGVVDATLVADGLAGLQRGFRRAGKDVSKDLRATLREAAEPVKTDAQALAVSAISNMTVPWSQMRIGVTQRAVYMVPKQRGQKGRDRRLRRPKFGLLLLNRSMIPAVERNAPQVERRVNDMLEEFAQRVVTTP